MSHPIVFARFNIHIKEQLNEKDFAKLQDTLFNAATWALGDDPEVFFEENTNTLGVSIEATMAPLSLVEAGATLGQCEAAYEKCGINPGPTWLSIHDQNGEVIDSSYAP